MAADPTTTTAVATAAASTTRATLKSAADKQQQQSDSRKQQDSSHTITALCQPVKTLHTLLGIPEHMELSQIELIYRAEGNANLVLALPQFKKVLRLPKMLPNVKQQQQQPQHEREKEQEQQRSTSETFLNQSARAGDLTMEDFVAYIEVIRRLLGNEFIFEADLVQIPKEADRDWINKHIKAARPAHRRDKEFCGQFGLLLPDATQLPAAIDILLGNSQQATATSAAATTKYELQPRERAGVGAGAIGDTYAVEIKPKQGWLLPTDVNDLFDTIKPTTATATTATTAAMPATTEATATTATKTTTSTTLVPAQALAKMAKTNTRCRYCAMQYLKLQQHKISRLSSYCPIELFSGTPARMIAALHALFECPQNNLRVFRNGVLIYGDHAESISWQQLKDTVFQSDKLQLIKHLLVACLLRDYGSATAEVAVADAGAAAVVKAVAGQPHSRATPAPTAAEPVTEAEAPATRATRAPRTQAQVSEAEMLCLPENCVLQKILHLQLLAKRNLQHMFQAGYASYEIKSYAALSTLLRKRQEVCFESLQHVEEYLLGATALDCSIMLTFREMCSETSLPPHPQLVQMPAHKKCYWTKVTILDLDPKPDSHFCKYVKQTRQSNTCQQLS